MSDGRTVLAALFEALAPPLEYLAADDFRHAARTTLPLDAIIGRLAAARAAVTDAAAGRTLQALEEVIGRVAMAAPEERATLLRRAHGLLGELQGDADGPAAPADYGCERGDVRPALAQLAAPVDRVSGVGGKRGAELVRFGLATVEDLLYHLPFRYEDRRIVTRLRDLVVGSDVSTEGEVAHVRQAVVGRVRRRVLEVALRDGPHVVLLVWFNQVGYFAQRFTAGDRLLVHGRVEPPMGNGPSRIVHPDVIVLGDEEAETRAAILPVYEKPTGMPAGVMRRLVQAAVDAHATRVPGVLPAALARRQRVIAPGRALRYLHAPPNEANLEALNAARSLAHRSLAFDELFFLQLGLALRRSTAGRARGTSFPVSQHLVPALRAALPFTPTAAQERAF